MLAGPAHAGMSVSVSDSCTAQERAAADAAPVDRFVVEPRRSSAPEDLLIQELSGKSLNGPCRSESTIHPQNVPEGPAIGASESQADLSDEEQLERLNNFYQLIQNTIQVSQSGGFPIYRCTVIACPLPAILQHGTGFQMKYGAEGKLGSGSGPLGTFVYLEAIKTP